MNVLYCGDANILDGLIVSTLSLVRATDADLKVYILTMKCEGFEPLTEGVVKKLERELKKVRGNVELKLLDITETVEECFPVANKGTRFTPYCMLRLYADQVEGMPERILYLDNDVVALKDPRGFYETEMEEYEVAGVLDRYGSHFFKRDGLKRQYLNSGVLLLNLAKIRENGVFERARKFCRNTERFLPDQAALNTFVKHKLIVDSKYNEQAEIKEDTVLKHFSNVLKFFPVFRAQVVKPWEIEKLHKVLGVYSLDGLLDEYAKIKRRIVA